MAERMDSFVGGSYNFSADCVDFVPRNSPE